MTDRLDMREAMGRFPTGVTVVTGVDGSGAPIGCTISAFSSLSLVPPLVLFCIGCGRYSHADLVGGAGFAVNVLRHDQADVAMAFARFDPDRFTRTAWRPGRRGIPLLAGAVAHIECDTMRAVDGGDHSIVIGAVVRTHLADGDPLIYAKGSFMEPATPDRGRVDAPPDWLLSAPW